jgi:hypothetical protein
MFQETFNSAQIGSVSHHTDFLYLYRSEEFCQFGNEKSYCRMLARLQTPGRVLMLLFARATAKKRVLVRIHIFLCSLFC